MTRPDPEHRRRYKRAFVPGLTAAALLVAAMFVPAGHDPIYGALTDGDRSVSLFELARAERFDDDQALLTPNPPRYTGTELLAGFLPFGGLGECLFLALAAAIATLVLFMGLAKWLSLLALVTGVAASYVYLTTHRNLSQFVGVLPGGEEGNPMISWFSPIVLLTVMLGVLGLLAASFMGGGSRHRSGRRAPQDVF